LVILSPTGSQACDLRVHVVDGVRDVNPQGAQGAVRAA
jgi:hypothetical protein